MKAKILIMILTAAIILASCSPASTTASTGTDNTPTLILDSDANGLISTDELDATFTQMRELLKEIEGPQPDVAARLEEEIAFL